MPTSERIGYEFAKPVYSLCTTSRRSRRQLSLARLPRWLKILPFGLFWAVVAVVFNVENYTRVWLLSDAAPSNWLADFRSIFVIVGPFLCTCFIANTLGKAILKPLRSATFWTFGWVFSAIASCVGGVAASNLAFSLWLNFWLSYWRIVRSLSELSSELALFIPFTLLGWLLLSLDSMRIAIQSTVVAFSSIPIALVVRRLILQRRCLAEPAGGASETQP